ncbi:Transmembrane protein [Trema orientale]|uniref:Transmembrane protein n=1 Tax=Trema orientale TaxID=63057 RepID=A0A2P5E8Q6_TREOI|nr:Transmembrane protein [Trema orientale]
MQTAVIRFSSLHGHRVPFEPRLPWHERQPKVHAGLKQHYWSRISTILLDQGLFGTIHERLFVVCLALNGAALALAGTEYFPHGRNRATRFSIVHILASTLRRSGVLLRVKFWLAMKLVGHSWVPLFIKTTITSLLQSLGGVHSSLRCFLHCMAHVRLISYSQRQRKHYFPQNSLRSRRHSSPPLPRLLGRLPTRPSFSLQLIRENSPIRRVDGSRKPVPVKISSPSGHASIIKFKGGGVAAGILGRISPSPLSEWHAFGIISNGKKDHMMLAGAIGDFTRSLPCPVDVNLIWVAKSIEQNFGKEIKEMVSGYPKDKVIVHDTALFGRPNLSKMSVDAAREWGAEVVVVTSNPEGTRDVVCACKATGVPAFGPIWDS